jgi:hypothetical protein
LPPTPHFGLRKQFERKANSFIFGEKTAAAKWKLDARLISSVKKQETIFLSGQMASSVARSEHQGAPFKFGVEPKYPEVTLDYGTRVSEKL